MLIRSRTGGKATQREVVAVYQAPGDALVMAGDFQSQFEHAVLKLRDWGALLENDQNGTEIINLFRDIGEDLDKDFLFFYTDDK